MAENDQFEFQDKKIDKLAKEITEANKRAFGQSLQEVIEQSDVLKEKDTVSKTSVPSTDPKELNSDEEEGSKNEFYSIVKPLVTYERDIADQIRQNDASMVSINLARQKREEDAKSTGIVAEKTEKIAIKSALLIASLILIIVGAGIGILILFLGENSLPVKNTEVQSSLITMDKKQSIDISSLDAINAAGKIEQVKQSLELNSNLLVELVITDKANGQTDRISPERFFGIFGQSAPTSLYRALGKNWLFGFYGNNQNDPFIFFSIDSFENAFSGMLSWEKDMAQNLGSIFIKPNVVILPSSTFSGSNFEDLIIKSKDVRVLKDGAGNIILLYSFLDTKNLIITTSEKAFREILNRFFASQVVR